MDGIALLPGGILWERQQSAQACRRLRGEFAIGEQEGQRFAASAHLGTVIGAMASIAALLYVGCGPNRPCKMRVPAAVPGSA